MHQQLTGYPALLNGLEVNHKDGNGLNNKSENLVVCSHHKNMQSFRRKKVGTSSRFVGVSFFDRGGRRRPWKATVRLRDKCFYVGAFYSEVEAARARDLKAREILGPHAHLNFSK